MILPGLCSILVIAPEGIVSCLHGRSAWRIRSQVQQRAVIFRKFPHIISLGGRIFEQGLRYQTQNQPKKRAPLKYRGFFLSHPLHSDGQQPQNQYKQKNQRRKPRFCPSLFRQKKDPSISDPEQHHSLFLPLRKFRKIRPGAHKNIGDNHAVSPRIPIGHIGKPVQRISGKGQKHKRCHQTETDLQQSIFLFLQKQQKHTEHSIGRIAHFAPVSRFPGQKRSDKFLIVRQRIQERNPVICGNPS